jgi:hypothetical protein
MSSARSQMKNTNFIMWLFGRSHLYRNNLKWKRKKKENKRQKMCGRYESIPNNNNNNRILWKKKEKQTHFSYFYDGPEPVRWTLEDEPQKPPHRWIGLWDHGTQRLRSLDSFISYGYDTSSMTTLSVFFFFFFLFHQQPTGKTKTNKQKRMSRTDVE